MSRKEALLASLAEGTSVSGIVKNVTDYGVFVDLGGIDGLIHVTDMSWGRIGHPSALFKPGDTVEASFSSSTGKSRNIARTQAAVAGTRGFGGERYPVDLACTARLDQPRGIRRIRRDRNTAWKDSCTFPRCRGPRRSSIHPR